MTNNTLLKSCASCGKPKPLTAFLQMTGPQGAIYGNICASCRSAQAKAPVEKEPDDRTTRSTIGLKIDAKAKEQAQKEDKTLREHKQEAHQEERKKKELTQAAKTEKTEAQAKDTKTRQEMFLDARQRMAALSKKSSAEKKPQDGTQARIHQQTETSEREAKYRNIESGLREEEKLTKPDFGNIYIDPQTGAEVRYAQSSVFQQYREWLGSSAHIRTFERLFGKNPPSGTTTPANKIAQEQQPAPKQASSPQQESNRLFLTKPIEKPVTASEQSQTLEYINTNYSGPGKKK